MSKAVKTVEGTEPAAVTVVATVVSKHVGHVIEVAGTTYQSKTAAIVALAAEGQTRGQIAKVLGIRYQFVNNVLSNQKGK